MAASSLQLTHLLPIREWQEHIIHKVMLNRVTLILAHTGSGKSTQVPQMLLESGLAPILCTQPRRLAVVAVATEVASERGCHVGEEIGYHIGQDKLTSANSKIIFQTAGVLLEELRCKGIQALSRYKVVILDEVHERSVESDLVLTCVKQLILLKRNIRLVLMSATVDSIRYKDYFGNIGRGENVEIVAIGSAETQLQNIKFQCKVSYLEQVVNLLGNVLDHVSLLNAMKENSLPYENGVDIGLRTQQMITDLVVHIHKNEHPSKSLMIFLPTYRALEQQWSLLKNTILPLKLHVLHSSIDVEQSLQAVKACHHDRKVILCTNVAESSVTLPGIAYVIDSCRSLEIYWDNKRKFHMPRLVWVSKSQANQRKGRTARTCDGEVFRMIPQDVFLSFKKFETPAIQLLSLHKQVLTITCAVSKAINNPHTLFGQALDPPDDSRVHDALDILRTINAVKVDYVKGKYTPTIYGRLLASLPLSIEAAMLVIRGGQQGMLREAIVLAAFMDMSPLPILKPFSQQNQYEMHLQCYYSPDLYHVKSDPCSYPSVLLANLIAFEFWQCVLKDKHRLERLAKCTGISKCLENELQSSCIEEEQKWCSAHYLCPSALCRAYETSAVILETLHRYRPHFLNKSEGPPSYYFACYFEHVCNLQNQEYFQTHISEGDDGIERLAEYITCNTCPFVAPEIFHSKQELQKLASLIGEVQKISQHATAAENIHEDSSDHDSSASLCRFFQIGMCAKGDTCSFSHCLSAKPMLCKFFSTTGCCYGAACRFRHDSHASNLVKEDIFLELEDDSSSPRPLSSIIPFWNDYGVGREEPNSRNKCYGAGLCDDSSCQEFVLTFGEEDFTLAETLSKRYMPSRIIATSTRFMDDSSENNGTELASRIDLLSEHGVKILWGVTADKLSPEASSNIPWREVGYIIWIIKSFGDEDTEGQKNIVKEFLTSLSSTILSEGIEDVVLLLTLYNSQFVAWKVEQAARDCFFFLSQSAPAASGHSILTGCPDIISDQEKLVAYVFHFYSPSEMLHGNYCDQFQRISAQHDYVF